MNEALIAEALSAKFYIPARTTLDAGQPARLKHGDTFGVFDPHGDNLAWDGNADGVYCRDTRHLSHFELRLNGARPLLLSSNVQSDNAALSVDLTNPDFFDNNRLVLPKDSIHIHRLKFLWNEAVYERLAILNFDEHPHHLRLSIIFDADFADLFEARGQKRSARGQRTAAVTAKNAVTFTYRGLDNVERRTQLAFAPPPERIDQSSCVFDMVLAPHEKRVMFVRACCSDVGCGSWERRDFFVAMGESRRALRHAKERLVKIGSSNALIDEVTERSFADLTMLMTDTEYGPYPYAGIPWFSSVFGRDALITALMMLWVDPSVARGVLGLLAATQATEIDAYRDAEPGKILHETRFGEMAALHEVPFGQYYGSVDSTPLFIMLAGRYLRRSGDVETIRALWPNVEAALGWIETFGDLDGDGFVEYQRQRETGLSNQGWKDSVDSVFHADGTLVQGPVALCEVQAYVYGAWCEAAFMARALGKLERVAQGYADKAERLRRQFEETFWCEELGTYAIALDGHKRRCEVVTSNAGQVLFTGIADRDRAESVADVLMEPACFSGWGIRTLSANAPRYNPMSYHNGSVWPHDNALIAMGFAHYGLKTPVLRILQGLTEAAGFTPLRRLPELFCGFGRKRRKGPVGYPVACSPQAWAAAAPIALLQATLGLTVDQDMGEIRLDRPMLPPFVDQVSLRNLTLADGEVDMLLTRHGLDVATTVLRRSASARIIEVH